MKPPNLERRAQVKALYETGLSVRQIAAQVAMPVDWVL